MLSIELKSTPLSLILNVPYIQLARLQHPGCCLNMVSNYLCNVPLSPQIGSRRSAPLHEGTLVSAPGPVVFLLQENSQSKQLLNENGK